MRKLMLVATLMAAFTVITPTPTALADANSGAAKTCQSDYGALGFKNRGECASFYARQGSTQPPPAGEAALSVVGTVYNKCIGLGTSCWVGIYGTGLLPGTTVSLYEEAYCCEMTFPVDANGTVTAEGIFICGGTSTRTFTWLSQGTTSSGETIAAEPLVLDEAPC